VVWRGVGVGELAEARGAVFGIVSVGAKASPAILLGSHDIACDGLLFW
jgi:hypothetical protein